MQKRAFCNKRINGAVCGGRLKRARTSEEVKHEDGAPILSMTLNNHRCERCGYRYPVYTVKKFVLDADDPQPMIGQYTKDVSRDPYRAS